ncbi:hypothetical protein [Devosia sp. FKR38]|uniref:hypothetical protein n=1 Tax=Devosia sp. FKR38 TaxID=2562312 RepID=UPI0010BF9438|nr:hypothetical protein [Devosia sp. FKR38]
MTALARVPVAQDSAAPALRSLADALVGPREQIESTFLDVGAGLAEGADILNRVTRAFEALPAQLQSPDMAEASSRLAEVGEQAQAMAILFANEQADLARLDTVVAAAAHPIADLRRAVKMMNIVAINARVVAAGIAVRGDDFEVFTTDIAALSESAASTIQAFTQVYERLTSEVAQAAHQSGQFENAHADTLGALAQSMQQALDALARQRAISVDGTAETGRITRQIADRIGNAVMALQVGDSTRQRIEHVESGISALCALIESDDLTEAQRTQATAAMGTLQANQLGAAADAFEQDVADAGAALADLAADASGIVRKSRETYGHNDGGESALATLSQAVSNAAKVLHDCESERGKLEQVASAVLSTVGILLGHVEAVQEIEANMRLVSLNAAVKCAQLGPRGAALNVIARQLRELTGETVTAAEGAMQGLHEAGKLARAFGEAASGDTTSRIGRLEHDATASLLLLQGVETALAQALGALERDVPKVRALLEDAAGRFTTQAMISDGMRSLKEELVELCPQADFDRPEGALALALTEHSRRYTMDGERRIHEQMFGKTLAVAAPTPAPADTATDDLDIFF